MTKLGLSSSSDVIAFDQNWHYLYSTSAGGGDLSNDAQIKSDRLNGALDMHENAQKVEWKTWSKISCHYTWMLHAKNYVSMTLSQKFFNHKQAQ